jgi:hypothetical protein
MTYATSSMLQLMQVAGRCLRYVPEKDNAYIVQAKDSALAYHYEQRWLYQDISDALHPRLVDLTYFTLEDLVSKVSRLLEAHNVEEGVKQMAQTAVLNIQAGEDFSLMFTGMPYDGTASDFESQAPWNVVPIPAGKHDVFVRVFNDYSSLGAEIKDPAQFLRNYLEVDSKGNSYWTCMRDMLSAMDYARRELLDEHYLGDSARGYSANKGTTWLTYVTFHFSPKVPAALSEFLADCVNRDETLTEYSMVPERWRAVTKLDLPLGASLAFLLDQNQFSWLENERAYLINLLREAAPRDTFGCLAAWRLTRASVPLPLLIADRIETFLTYTSFDNHVYRFPSEPN